MKDQDKSSPLSAKDISQYLREHTNFFEEYPELLADISLPHDSGQAISLVERQVSVLRERNIDMRHRLSKLLDNARENDKLFEKTRRLVLMMIESQTLPDLVNAVFYSFENDFKISATSLIIFADPSRVPESRARILPLHQARESVGRIIGNSRIICGDFPKSELAFVFDEQAAEVGSAAVAPLIHGNCFGLLSVGSTDPHYYRSSMGTMFLSHISEVLNRLLPRYLANK